MAKDRRTTDQDNLIGNLAGDHSSGWVDSLLADENEFDSRALWRLVAWGVGSLGALVVAILAAQSSVAIRQEAATTATLLQQLQQMQWISKESENETLRLAAEIETLNYDRDRLYSRMTTLEHELDLATNATARQSSSAAIWPSASIPPAMAILPIARVEDIPGAPTQQQALALPRVAPVVTAASSNILPPLPKPKPVGAKAEPEPVTVGSILPPSPDGSDQETASITPVHKTEFGIDLGGANSVEGLRVLWRNLVKSHTSQLEVLRPLIVVKEQKGLRLRLVAGPLNDAATAAKICASLIENNRTCETSAFDGQHLALTQEAEPISRKKPANQQSGKPSGQTPSFSLFPGVN